VSNIKMAIREMYPRISWELVADTLGFAEHHCSRWSYKWQIIL